MEPAKAIQAVQELISQGETEQALEQLLPLVAEAPELAQAARLQQADFFQLKSQSLRGVISPEGERLGNTQILDKILQILQRVEAGKTTLVDEIPEQPNSRQPWRYYLAGVVMTLAIASLVWNFFGKSKKTVECPEFGAQKTVRVMILPFKKTSSDNTVQPEFDLSDKFNDMVAKDPQLSFKAEADVNEAYDIDQNYPNPSEAAEIAQNCAVELIVWGKTNSSKDTFEVRYKWVESHPTDTTAIPDYTGNSTALNSEGVWRSDIKTISKWLYLLVATHERPTDMAFSLLSSLEMANTAMMKSAAIDTMSMFMKADAYAAMPGKKDSALAIYDQILVNYPDNYRALVGKGWVDLQKGDFTAAAQHLHKAQPDPTKADPALLRVRTDAYLQSGWPGMARLDLEQLKKDSSARTSKKWIKTKGQIIEDSIQRYQNILDRSKGKLVQKPDDVDAKIDAARAYNALGQPEEALKYSKNVIQSKPKNKAAIKAKVEAYAQQGDIDGVVKTIQDAERNGVRTKGIPFQADIIRPLLLDTVKVRRKQ